MKHILSAALAFAAAAPAAAYTTYLKPNAYWTTENALNVEGSYASQFFTPAIAVPAQLTVLGPDGAPAPFNSIAVQGAATRLDASLFSGGTYRVTTGEQVGAVTPLVGIDGQWRPLGQGETPPEGAPVTTLQTVTLADLYVTRGRATRHVVDQPNGRLALKPVTHPNQVLAATGFEVDVLFDGAPLANTGVVLYSAGDLDTDLDTFAVTDANGRARFAFAAPGQYVIAARHRASMPAGGAQIGSYTTTLTFEALAAPYAETDIAPRSDNERRRRRGGGPLGQ
jgi:hypothetical protein